MRTKIFVGKGCSYIYTCPAWASRRTPNALAEQLFCLAVIKLITVLKSF